MESKKEIIETLKEYLLVILKDIDSIVELLDEERENIACDKIGVLSERLEILLGAIGYIDTKVKVEDFNNILVEIVEALQNEDYILVGDLFNYEIKPLIIEIQDEINN